VALAGFIEAVLRSHLDFVYTLFRSNPHLKRTFLLRVRFKSKQSITNVLIRLLFARKQTFQHLALKVGN